MDHTPPAHPTFSAHFTDRVYDADLPENDETLPFGTDDGSDLLAGWACRADELVADPRLDVVLGGSARSLARLAANDEESADQLVSAAFVLLRQTRSIDERDRRLAVTALRRLTEEDTDETYEILLRDLETFGPDGGEARRSDARARPWLVINGGWNDPPHRRWLRRIAQRVTADPAWAEWWSHAPVDRLEMHPAPVGPGTDHHPPTVEHRRRSLMVIGSSPALSQLFRELEASGVPPPHTGLHRATPEAAEHFRRLILSLFVAAAAELRMPEPPDRLPHGR